MINKTTIALLFVTFLVAGCCCKPRVACGEGTVGADYDTGIYSEPDDGIWSESDGTSGDGPDYVCVPA